MPGSAPNFDRLAGLYRWMEFFSFGPFLQRTRCAHLDKLKGARRALILGDGDGRFTARLLETNAEIEIDAVDASEGMLRALVHRAGANAGRVRTHIADIRYWTPAKNMPPADLIVTHFFLDCLTTAEVEGLGRRLRAAALPEARWLVSDFAVPRSNFGRFAAAPMVRALYWAFAVLTGLTVQRLPNHGAALRSAGYVLNARRSLLGGMLFSELWHGLPPGV